MDFEERLKKAIDRGKKRSEEATRAEREKELSQQDVKQRHSEYRLKLSDHIEACLQRLPNHFPGFQYETIFGDRGWGGACYRDDLNPAGRGRRDSFYSRLEVTVRPLSSYPILELTAKGTIRNKEVFARSHYAELDSVDFETFEKMVDLWIVEFAELYAAQD